MRSDKKKILFVSHAAVVPANRELFRELSGDYEVRILCPRRWRGSLIRDLRAGPEEGILPEPVVGAGNGSTFFYGSTLAEARAWKPDLVFLDEEPWSAVALQICLFFPRTPRVFYTKQNIYKRLPPPFSLVQRHWIGSSAGAFVISDEAAGVLARKGYRGKPSVLPHSLHPDRCRILSPAERAEVRARFRVPADRFVVGYFGRMSEEKGVRDLLAASRALPGMHFLFVGNGPLAGEIASIAGERVAYLPAVPHDQAPLLMGAVDLVAVPSRTTPRWKEQFGRVILEAAACGVPVLGSDSGEIPKLIARLSCGVSVPEGNVGELVAAIARFAADPDWAEALGKAGARAAVEGFAHSAIARLLAQELERMAFTDSN